MNANKYFLPPFLLLLAAFIMGCCTREIVGLAMRFATSYSPDTA